MAKNSTKVYGAAGKTNLLMFDPDTLTLVTDESSPLFDKRVHQPIDEAMVLNIMHQGVFTPIVVIKNPETGETEVVAGRQRVKNAREANARLRATGRMPVNVPGYVRKGATAAQSAGVMASENAIRKDETPMARAEKMRNLAALGNSDDMLSVIFGCSLQTVRNTMALLDCCAAVRNAVAAGKLGAGHALKLSKLEPEAQRAKLADLIEADNTSSGHEKARKQRAIVEPSTPKLRSRKEVQARLAASSDAAEIAVLRWVLGMEPAALLRAA